MPQCMDRQTGSILFVPTTQYLGNQKDNGNFTLNNNAKIFGVLIRSQTILQHMGGQSIFFGKCTLAYIKIHTNAIYFD
jgi:hypothetical protein